MKSKQEIKEVLLCLNLQETNFQLWNIARKELIETVDESYFTLAIELLASEKDEEVNAAIISFRFLKLLNPRKALPQLIPFLENPIHCESAFATVSQLFHLEIAPTLIRYLAYPIAEIRLEALISLGRINYPELLDIALYALNDSYPRVRAHACYLLGNLRNPIAVDALIKLIYDREVSLDVTVAFEAIHALGAIGDVAAVEALKNVIEGVDEESALAALHSLWLMRIDYESYCAEQLLSNPHPSVRKDIAHNMAFGYQPEQHVEKLIHVAQNDKSYEVRETAIESLDAIGTKEALEAVEYWNKHHKRQA